LKVRDEGPLETRDVDGVPGPSAPVPVNCLTIRFRASTGPNSAIPAAFAVSSVQCGYKN
jgi:hypothetical protein